MQSSPRRHLSGPGSGGGSTPARSRCPLRLDTGRSRCPLRLGPGKVPVPAGAGHTALAPADVPHPQEADEYEAVVSAPSTSTVTSPAGISLRRLLNVAVLLAPGRRVSPVLSPRGVLTAAVTVSSSALPAVTASTTCPATQRVAVSTSTAAGESISSAVDREGSTRPSRYPSYRATTSCTLAGTCAEASPSDRATVSLQPSPEKVTSPATSPSSSARSEERRVGKECRWRWWAAPHKMTM